MTKDLMNTSQEMQEERLRVMSLIDTGLKHIANGGALTEFCRSQKIEYDDFMAVVKFNKHSRMQLKIAYEARREHTRERIVDEIMTMGTVDITGMFDEHGEPLSMAEIPDSIKRSIIGIDRSVRFDKDGNQTVTTKLKFTDKLKSLELMCKLDGLLVQKVHVKQEITLESLLTDSFKKTTETVENETDISEEQPQLGDGRPSGDHSE